MSRGGKRGGAPSYEAGAVTGDTLPLDAEAEARARLVALVESSDDAIVSKTLQGIVTSWNQAAERLFGWTAAEAIGRSITFVIPEDRLHEERDILARISRGERVEHFETVRVRKDGTPIDISLTISPIRDGTGRIVGASKIARDIRERRRQQLERMALLEREREARQRAETLNEVGRALAAKLENELERRRKAEEEVRALNADLERRVRERTHSLEATVKELDTFAYTVAHDLRAPLRAVHSFGQMLLEDAGGKLDKRERSYLENMITAGARMDRLIQDLLAYSRITREQLVLERVDLDAAVATAVAQVREEPGNADAADIEVAGPLPLVMGHAVTLSQAILNLVHNAVKFVRPGTRARVRVFAEERGGRARLWVEDNGIGIAPEYHPKLFGIFERLHSPEAYPGTGVGLAIVRRSVERMGGTVGLESEPGVGSRFFLELRMAEPDRG